MLYYPEVDFAANGDPQYDCRSFSTPEKAISFYRRMYGDSLMAVILDNDPETIKPVWVRGEK